MQSYSWVVVLLVICSIHCQQLTNNDDDHNDYSVISYKQPIQHRRQLRQSDLKISVQLKNVYQTGTIYLTNDIYSSEKQLISTSESSSVRLDISYYLSDNPTNFLRVSNGGGRRHWWKPWERSLQLVVWVNDNIVYSEYTSCRYCHSKGNAFECSLDKSASADSAVSCVKHDD